MKTFNKLLIAMAAIALLFTTSCLDDEMVDIEVENFAGSPYIADFNEMPNSAGYIKRSFQGTTDESVSYSTNFRVNLSSPWQLDKDLQVTVKLDDQAVLDYIANVDPEFQLLSAEKHNFTETTVTIPAGEREVEFTVDFWPAGLSADDKYMVAFSIESTSNPDVLISGNYGTQYVQIGVTNIFHGSYTLDAYWLYGGATDYSSLCSTDDITLATISSRIISTSYTYPGWGYNYLIEVDMDNPQTIEGHDGAMKFTVTVEGKEDACEQHDDYNGEVWNYCYQDAGGKWHFKLCQTYTSGSGPHFSANWYHQN